MPGYTTQPVTGSGIGDSSLSGCPVLVNNPPGVTADSLTSMTNQISATSVSETLLQMAPGDAQQAIASFAAMPSTCHSFTGKIDGYDVTFSTASLPVPAHGDQTVASRITGTITELSAHVYTDVVVIRHHNTLIMLDDVGLGPDTSFTDQVSAMAYSKVAARW